jgi:predicted enzyme related to lactoylglutathione lyase
MPAPVTHFEINVKDAAKGNEFYHSLFGWKVTTLPGQNYGMVDTGVKMGIGGGIGQVGENDRPSALFYAQVRDVEACLTQVVNLGGRVVVPLTEVPGMVTFAQFADPEGNVIGLVKGPETPPANPQPRRRSVARKAAPKKAGSRKKAARKPKAKAKGRTKTRKASRRKR